MDAWAFEREIGFHVSLRRRLLRFYVRAAAPGYLGTISLLTLLILAVPLARSLGAGGQHRFTDFAWPAGDGSRVRSRDCASSTDPLRTCSARVCFRDSKCKAVPESLRTIVVVPVLLTSDNDISEEVERLEIHYLANSEGDLRFALLSDWVDAPTETFRMMKSCSPPPQVASLNLNKTARPRARRRRPFFPLPPKASLE